MGCKLKISRVILSVTLLFSLESIALVSPVGARDLLHPSNNTDLEALYSIKSHIGNDTFGFLATWNDSLHFCHWEGVTCSTRHQRVIALDLFQKGLGGTLSPYVGNLTFLKHLNLGENNFTGVIPREVGQLYRLQNMSLHNNSFQGEIPKNLSKCSALREIYLSINFLEGKIPSELSSLYKLQVLFLSLNNLRGSIPSTLGNLSALLSLDLSLNNFTGEIPQEIGRLHRLQNITLYSNHFQGEIPKNLTKCSALRVIDFFDNFLEGKIPSELSSLSNLQALGLSRNSLRGSIPSSLGNLSALQTLALSFNNLEGSVPTEFAKLSIRELLMSSNNLSGPLPTGIFNISSIQYLYLASNQLNGSLPRDFGLHVPELSYFSLDQNQFSGPLPASVTNASRLRVLDIGMNNFLGPVPMNIGNLQKLVRLVLSGNQLGTPSIGLKFLNSLSNCPNLQILHLDENNHTDNLPRSIANLSAALISLRLDGNNISGHIPESIGGLINLQGLYLSRNKLSGGIPSSIGEIRSLTILEMQENMLDGVIPISLSNCRSLSKLNLSHNRLTGGVPPEILRRPSSTLLDLCLAQNQLSGLLPIEVGNLINLARLDVSNNNLSGELPYTLGSCVVLQFLSLQSNHFNGNIPEQFEKLKSLQTLDLSSNIFSGKIPASLAKLPFLKELNLSFNVLEGEVPDEGTFRNITAFSVAGNKKLCGGIKSLQLPECEKERPPREREAPFEIVAFLLAVSYLIFAMLVHICLFRYCTRERKFQTTEEASNSHLGDHYLKISYKELCQATDGFSSTNLIATGRCSSVYMGSLKYSEQKVAVKVLHLQQQGARKGFEAECEALRNTRHRNIVKIITSCSGTDSKGSEFKALVYEFMPNGSLESWIHPSSSDIQKQKNLNLIQRLNIAIDVASAIDYLHHCCEIRIIHRDIKPSNVLLDHKLSAHLGDFGAARSVLLPIEKTTHLRIRSSAIGIIGTVGYIALECGMGGPVSRLADVYSYGILLLEMFSGKRPTDSMFIDDFSLHNYVNMNIPDQVLHIADPRLLSEQGGESHRTAGQTINCISLKTDRCLASIFHIGIKCSAPMPRDRMDIADALMELKAIRDVFLRVDETEAGRVEEK